MICAQCGIKIPAADRCVEHGLPALLEGRYRLDRALSRTVATGTWFAIRAEDGLAVVIKARRWPKPLTGIQELRAMADQEAWNGPAASHGARILEIFRGKFLQCDWLFSVRERVRGRTLRGERDRHPFDSPEIITILSSLLARVEAIHSLSPPVFHRNLRASNVIRRWPDGALVLVDPLPTLVQEPAARIAARGFLRTPDSPAPGQADFIAEDRAGIARVILEIILGRAIQPEHEDIPSLVDSVRDDTTPEVVDILRQLAGKPAGRKRATIGTLFARIQETRFRMGIGHLSRPVDDDLPPELPEEMLLRPGH